MKNLVLPTCIVCGAEAEIFGGHIHLPDGAPVPEESTGLVGTRVAIGACKEHIAALDVLVGVGEAWCKGCHGTFPLAAGAVVEEPW